MVDENDKKLLKEELERLDKPADLSEYKMNWAGKLFFAGAAAFIASSALGAKPAKLPFKVRGSKEQIKAVMDAITSSRDFQREINKPGATIEKVIDKLRLKNLDKANFERVTGKPWPL